MEEQSVLKHKLEKLTQEHKDLDIAIENLFHEHIPDQLAIQRLKRRKLVLKDQMISIRTRLLPDIIA